MRKTLLVGLAVASLAACSRSAKEPPTVAQTRPPAVKPHVTSAKKKPSTAKPQAKKPTAVARRPVHKAPAPEDTATPRNPLLNH